MAQVFGEFIDEPVKSREFLMLGFSPSSAPLQQRWRNNGLSADFLADYLTTFFPNDDNDPNTFDRENELKGAVSYIANEMLENAMKFSDTRFDYQVSFQVQLFSDHLTLCVSNNMSSENVQPFQSFINELLNTDPQELYIRQIERAEEDQEMMTSSLGLLTMIDDYNAKLGWKFEDIQEHPEITLVSTMVRLLV